MVVEAEGNRAMHEGARVTISDLTLWVHELVLVLGSGSGLGSGLEYTDQGSTGEVALRRDLQKQNKCRVFDPDFKWQHNKFEKIHHALTLI